MQRTVSALAARQRVGELGELLEGVYYRGDEVVIERVDKHTRGGIPMDRFWQTVGEIRADNEGADPEQVERNVDAAVAAVRERFRQMWDEVKQQESDLTPEEAGQLAVAEVAAYRAGHPGPGDAPTGRSE